MKPAQIQRLELLLFRALFIAPQAFLLAPANAIKEQTNQLIAIVLDTPNVPYRGICDSSGPDKAGGRGR